MSSTIRPLLAPRGEASLSKWARWRDIPIAILAWTALVALALWGAGHIVRTLLLLVLAALLAYALAPGVKLLQRVMPRFLAILIMYIVVLGVVSLLIYFVVSTAIQQISTSSTFVQYLLTPKSNGQLNPLEQTLQSVGISQSQIASARDQIIARTEGIAGSAVPLLTGFFDFLLDVVVVAVLSIYFLIDGSRITTWFRTNMPQAAQANFLLDTFQRVVWWLHSRSSPPVRLDRGTRWWWSDRLSCSLCALTWSPRIHLRIHSHSGNARLRSHLYPCRLDTGMGHRTRCAHLLHRRPCP